MKRKNDKKEALKEGERRKGRERKRAGDIENVNRNIARESEIMRKRKKIYKSLTKQNKERERGKARKTGAEGNQAKDRERARERERQPKGPLNRRPINEFLSSASRRGARIDMSSPAREGYCLLTGRSGALGPPRDRKRPSSTQTLSFTTPNAASLHRTSPGRPATTFTTRRYGSRFIYV